MASARRLPTAYNTSTFGGGGRNYTSLSTWESDKDNDLVTATAGEVLDCYDDAASYDQTINLAGATTNSSYFRVIRPAAGQGHNGVPTTGFYIESTSGSYIVQISEDYSQAHDLICRLNINTSASWYTYRLVNANTALIGCFSYDIVDPGTGTPAHFLTSFTSGSGYLVNCAAVKGTSTNGGFRVGQTGATVYLYNCMAVDTGGLGFLRNGGTVVAVNCLANASSNGFFGTFSSSFNNVSVDTTAPGTNSRISQTFTFENLAGADIRITTSDAGAKDYGLDLSGDANYAFTDDIVGNDFITWDIGFFEPNPTIIGLFLDIDFEEGNFSDITTIVTDISSLVTITTPGLNSTNYKATMFLDGTTNTRYLKSTKPFNTTNEFNILFAIDVSSLTIPNPTSFRPLQVIASMSGSGNNLVSSFLTDPGDGLGFGFSYGDDTGGNNPAEARPKLTTGKNFIRYEIKRATSTISADGQAKFWMNGVQIYEDLLVDNYDIWATYIDLRIGVTHYTGSAVGLAGYFSIDEITARNDGTLQDFPVVPPVLTALTKKVVFKDVETPIKEFTLTSTGQVDIEITVTAGTISLTLLGSVTIIAGAQDTATITIRGTSSSELEATLNTLLYQHNATGSFTCTVTATNTLAQESEKVINILVALIAIEDQIAMLAWRNETLLPLTPFDVQGDMMHFLDSPRTNTYLLLGDTDLTPDPVEFSLNTETLTEAQVQIALIFTPTQAELDYLTILNSANIVQGSLTLTPTLVNLDLQTETLAGTQIIQGSLVLIPTLADLAYLTLAVPNASIIQSSLSLTPTLVNLDYLTILANADIVQSSLSLTPTLGSLDFLTLLGDVSVGGIILTPTHGELILQVEAIDNTEIIQSSLSLTPAVTGWDFAALGPSVIGIVAVQTLIHPLGLKFKVRSKRIVFN